MAVLFIIQPRFCRGTDCHRGKNRKYAANSKLAEHTGTLQRLYLRFLCAKRAVCSRVPEFAAYFRAAIPEVRGKTEIGRPDPGFALPRPAVLLPKIGPCSEVSDFSPHFRKARLNHASRSGKPPDICFSPNEILVMPGRILHPNKKAGRRISPLQVSPEGFQRN